MSQAIRAVQPRSDDQEASLFQQCAERRNRRASTLKDDLMRSAQYDIVRCQTWKLNGHMQQQDRAIKR